MIEFEHEAKHYGYVIKVSPDLTNWTTVVTQHPSNEPKWGGPISAMHDIDIRGRYVRVEFTELQGRCWASMREFQVFPERAESPYYAQTYEYRLRWNDVIYEPGELKAVAFQGGKEIGTAGVRTAGKPDSNSADARSRNTDVDRQGPMLRNGRGIDQNGVVCPRQQPGSLSSRGTR